MSKNQQNNLSAIGEKISRKQDKDYDKFDRADILLKEKITRAEEDNHRERLIRKSYALTKQDLMGLEKIKDKFLNEKIVLSDSYILRLAIKIASELPQSILVENSYNVPKIPVGRPKRERKTDE